MRPSIRNLVACAALVAGASVSRSAAASSTVEVPIDVGLGPAAYTITGPVAKDQPWHFGLKLSVAAIIDQELIRQNQGRIPQQYRKYANAMDEVRISSIFIPDSLIISPKYRNTGMYGITWRPIGLGIPLLTGAFAFRVQAGLLLTYAYLYSDTLETTHFLRPGIGLGAEFEIKFSKAFLVSFGWESGFYVPEKVGSFMEIQPFDQTMWHFGQAFFKLHFRFPYETRL